MYRLEQGGVGDVSGLDGFAGGQIQGGGVAGWIWRGKRGV